jgi:hypothetical protein
MVRLNYNGKRYSKMVSRLVVESFIRTLDEKEIAIHKNKSRTSDAALENL